MSETLEATETPASGHAPKYTRNTPYQSAVLVNELLTAPGSEKETRHVELALEDGMTYTPGDAVGILPENRREAVDEVLHALNMRGDERVLDHYKVDIDLDEALRTRLAIGKLERGRITQMNKLAPENEGLKALAGSENKARAEEYCYGREFIDLLHDFPGVITSPQQLFQVLARLTPRMYSIASSQALHPDNVQTTVRVVRYDAHGRNRQGLASGHLGDRAPIGETMPIFLHANGKLSPARGLLRPRHHGRPRYRHRSLPRLSGRTPGPGATGDNWLFFGEQRRSLDFLYQHQLESMHKDGVLTHLDTAFSRDQAKKVYVQDRMQERASELYAWLERGAFFYVCGDATRMAKDVELALLDAIARGSNGTLDHAAEYLGRMKKDKRYQRDVY